MSETRGTHMSMFVYIMKADRLNRNVTSAICTEKIKKFQREIIRIIKKFLQVHMEEKTRHSKKEITYKLYSAYFIVSQKLKTQNKILLATYKLEKQNSYMK
jgi:hypothetical protein